MCANNPAITDGFRREGRGALSTKYVLTEWSGTVVSGIDGRRAVH